MRGMPETEQHLLEVLPHAVVLVLGHRARGLPALEIDEDAAVDAAAYRVGDRVCGQSMSEKEKKNRRSRP